MAKTQRKSKKSIAAQRLTKTSNGISKLARQLDAGALAYRRLLADPCHAPMVSIPFAGTASGYLYRTRTVITAGSTNVCSMVTLAPTYQFVTNNSALVRNGPIITWGTDAYGAVTNQQGLVPSVVETGPGKNTSSQFRLVAGCIRATYTGSEMNKSGMVYGAITSSNPWNGRGLGPAGTGGVGTVSIGEYLSNAAQSFVRLNGTHEVRWVPDQESLEFTGTTNGDNLTESRSGGALSLGVVGHPTGGTVVYEVIGVWEVTPEVDFSGGGGSGGAVIPAPVAPRSSNTLNHVLSTLGDVAGFVVAGLGGPQHLAAMAANRMLTGLPTRRTTPMLTHG